MGLIGAISDIYDKLVLRNYDFIIVSNNCWGYRLYKILGSEYNTPFVGLYMYPSCYLKLLNDFEELINSELVFCNVSKYTENFSYPVAIIGDDIEIHFLHYNSEQEAKSKWNRRVERLNDCIKSNIPIYFKFCDRDLCSKENLIEFHSIEMANKISFSAKYNLDINNHIYLPFLKDNSTDSIINGDILFNKRYLYLSLSRWIKTKRVKPSVIKAIFDKLM